MKVYFVGAHGTGKTTLARYVSEQYKLPMITEVARMVLSEKEYKLDTLRHDINLVDEYQEQVFYRQMAEENKFKSSFVSDRSALDVLAYSAQHTRILSSLLKAPEFTSYLAALRGPDVFIFLVRPSKATLKADGVREVINWDGIVAIDAQIKFMLEMWGLRYYPIAMDNMQERTKLVNGILDMYQSIVKP
jgi:predicted ATPase